MVLIFLGRKLVGANFYVFCIYADTTHLKLKIMQKVSELTRPHYITISRWIQDDSQMTKKQLLRHNWSGFWFNINFFLQNGGICGEQVGRDEPKRKPWSFHSITILMRKLKKFCRWLPKATSGTKKCDFLFQKIRRKNLEISFLNIKK